MASSESADTEVSEDPNKEEVVDSVAASSVRTSLTSFEDEVRRKAATPRDSTRPAVSLISLEDAIRRKTTIATPIASLKEDITRLAADIETIVEVSTTSLASQHSLDHADVNEAAQTLPEETEKNNQVETLASLEEEPHVHSKDFDEMNEMIVQQIQPLPRPNTTRRNTPGAFAAGGCAPFLRLNRESGLGADDVNTFTNSFIPTASTNSGTNTFTPTASANFEGLVQALPVLEINQADLVAAEPVLFRNNKRVSIAIACALLVGILAATCLVAALVVLLDDNDDDTITPVMEGMQTLPTPKDIMFSILLDSGLKEPQLSESSAQTLAFEWLAEDPNLLDYTPERVVQRYVLSTLYHSTQGPLWTYDNNWLSYSHHECTWFHSDIFFGYLEQETSSNPCNSESGLYERLWLPENNLNGTLPEELYALTSLQSLDMMLNSNLRGSIITEIGKLTNMVKFSLLHTSLDGPIPSEVGLLNKLKIFYLSKEEAAAVRFHGTIPTEFWSLTSLEEISFTHQNFSGKLPNDLTHMTALQGISMIRNAFTGSMPPAWGHLSE